MKDTLLRILRNALLAFVLVTLGFALGKETTQRRFASATTSSTNGSGELPVANVSAGTRAVVYYAHAALRCATCNTIEVLAKGTVEGQFDEEMVEGQVEWRVVNFQEDEAFAKRYDIVSSSVVVVAMRGDAETGYERLDEVWTKVDDPPVFEDYVARAIERALAGNGGNAG